MVERSLSMREAHGSIPWFSTFLFFNKTLIPILLVNSFSVAKTFESFCFSVDNKELKLFIALFIIVLNFSKTMVEIK